ncbi:hypothetical protein JAB1_14330 [Janthinobacterium sp. MP5059B]|nr:hypothetical protein JAB1_14330 [Janthinobacterium sp. MP5059B]
MAWYDKWAIMVIAGAIGLAGYEGIPWCKMDITVWAYWVAAVGTISTLLGTIWLATNESRHRRAEALSKAKLTALHIHMNLLHTESLAKGVLESLSNLRDFLDEHAAVEHDVIKAIFIVSDTLDRSVYFTADELSRLIPLPDHCADKIALGQGVINACVKILKGTDATDTNTDSLREHLSECIGILSNAIPLIEQGRDVIEREADWGLQFK